MDKAIAAGLLMGEGCICLHKFRVKDYRSKKWSLDRIGLSVSISMADKTVIDWLHDRWSGYRGCRKDYMEVFTITSNPTKQFLYDLKPFIFGKKLPQLELAIEFQTGRVPGHRSKERREWELYAYKKMGDLKGLHRKGGYERRKIKI